MEQLIKKRRVEAAETSWDAVSSAGGLPIVYVFCDTFAARVHRMNCRHLPQSCADRLLNGLQNMGSLEQEGSGKPGRFQAVIDTVIGNIQLVVSNIHVRYEVGHAKRSRHVRHIMVGAGAAALSVMVSIGGAGHYRLGQAKLHLVCSVDDP